MFYVLMLPIVFLINCHKSINHTKIYLQEKKKIRVKISIKQIFQMQKLHRQKKKCICKTVHLQKSA